MPEHTDTIFDVLAAEYINKINAVTPRPKDGMSQYDKTTLLIELNGVIAAAGKKIQSGASPVKLASALDCLMHLTASVLKHLPDGQPAYHPTEQVIAADNPQFAEYLDELGTAMNAEQKNALHAAISSFIVHEKGQSDDNSPDSETPVTDEDARRTLDAIAAGDLDTMTSRMYREHNSRKQHGQPVRNREETENRLGEDAAGIATDGFLALGKMCAQFADKHPAHAAAILAIYDQILNGRIAGGVKNEHGRLYADAYDDSAHTELLTRAQLTGCVKDVSDYLAAEIMLNGGDPRPLSEDQIKAIVEHMIASGMKFNDPNKKSFASRHPEAGYHPEPPDVLKQELPAHVMDAMEKIAETAYGYRLDALRARAKSDGRSFAGDPDNVIWQDLSAKQRHEYAAQTAYCLKMAQALDYQIIYRASAEVPDMDAQMALCRAAAGEIAVLSHDLWAKSMRDNGVVYGPERNQDSAKGQLTDPDLVPYERLGGYDPEETNQVELERMTNARNEAHAVIKDPISHTLRALVTAFPELKLIKSDPNQIRRDQASDTRPSPFAAMRKMLDEPIIIPPSTPGEPDIDRRKPVISRFGKFQPSIVRKQLGVRSQVTDDINGQTMRAGPARKAVLQDVGFTEQIAPREPDAPAETPAQPNPQPSTTPPVPSPVDDDWI